MPTSRTIPLIACHSLPGRSEAAAHVHWHGYLLTFTAAGKVDQDEFVAFLARTVKPLFAENLNDFMPDSSDEGLAAWLYAQTRDRVAWVKVETDGQREALAP